MRLVLSSVTLLAGILLAGCDKTSQTKGKEDTGPKGAGAPSGAGKLTPENTKLEWLGTKKDGKHTGTFEHFSGVIKPIDKPFEDTKVSLDIDTDSLKADDPKLTAHLKSPDFFDVKKHPKATFESTSIKAKKDGDNTHVITGDLTLHGTKKEVSFPVKVKETDDLLTLDGKLTIDRTEFDMSFDPKKVNKEVTIEVSSKVARK